MSWGTELWDQYDNISAHTAKGIDFLERYGAFVDQRSKIENEYATKLRRLVKQYLPKGAKKEEHEIEGQFTYARAYRALLDELGDQAGQHEVVAENLSSQVAAELGQLVRQLKEDRRKHLSEGARLQAQLQSSLTLLAKTKEKYEKAFGASERALDAYQRADADLNLSRAEVEKQRMNSTVKSQQCDDAKNEYANQLQKTNEAQRRYYEELLPAVFQCLQDLDERRVSGLRGFVMRAAQAERDVLPIVGQCLDGATRAAESIDEGHDSRLVVEKYKSGFTHPVDLPFEDLNCAASDTASVNGSTNSIPMGSGSGSGGIPGSAEKRTILGTITGGRVKKRSGLLGLFNNAKGSSHPNLSPKTSSNGDKKEDFSDLPPNQRRKKLQQRIDEINQKVVQETAARDGLMKMKQVYEANPALGDPMSIQGQLADNGHRLDKLRAELKKFQGFLDEMEGRGASAGAHDNNGTPGQRASAPAGSSAPNLKPPGGAGVGGRRRGSVSDGAESLSRSASDSSVTGKGPNNGSGDASASSAASNMSEPIRKVTCRIVSAVTKTTTSKDSKKSNSQPPSNPSPESGIVASAANSSNSSLQQQTTTTAAATATAAAAKAANSNNNGQQEEEDEFFDTEPLPILGRCKALYPFEVTSEGSIRMEENEELWVIETDQGDGWTRVRRTKASPTDPMPEGFVPTSYVDVYERFSQPL